jgi:pyridoxine 4-dehydrogenase
MESALPTRGGQPPAAAAGTVTLGGDLTVHRMGFGAMRLAGPGVWGEPRNPEAALAVLRRAVELGVNFIDTADSYGPEVSERLIAEALYPYPPSLVIATKGGLLRPPSTRAWVPDGRPAHLKAACEGSLRRLRVDRIDVYQLHAVDPRVPLEESVGSLVELQRAGKIRHIGLCNVNAGELVRARRSARIVSVQNLYNLTNRTSEDVVEACEQNGLAFIPWYPLAAGPLARPRGPVGQVAARSHATPAQVALAWLLQRSPVTLPIPGTSSIAHLEDNVRAAALRLPQEGYAALAGLYQGA